MSGKENSNWQDVKICIRASANIQDIKRTSEVFQITSKGIALTIVTGWISQRIFEAGSENKINWPRKASRGQIWSVSMRGHLRMSDDRHAWRLKIVSTDSKTNKWVLKEVALFDPIWLLRTELSIGETGILRPLYEPSDSEILIIG